MKKKILGVTSNEQANIRTEDTNKVIFNSERFNIELNRIYTLNSSKFEEEKKKSQDVVATPLRVMRFSADSEFGKSIVEKIKHADDDTRFTPAAEFFEKYKHLLPDEMRIEHEEYYRKKDVSDLEKGDQDE